ncbi:tail fiber assembly protein [Pantoea sp. NPDC088449]|uniref:tail fiber assembly protein n=1 Tax=Pantoea sp. NPDC088449 TaxID=3364392 RepID=UPI00382323AA
MTEIKTTALDENGLAKMAGMLTVYSFESDTGIFTGASDEYLPAGVGLPAYACAAAPPIAGKGFVAVNRNGLWFTEADHRGETVYSVADGAAMLIEVVGDYPEATTSLKPVTPWDKWDGEKWVTNPAEEKAADIKEAQERQAALIAEANAITQAWQTQLRLDMITDTDKSSLVAWMKYVQDVQAVKTEEAPALSWPQKPQ